MQTIEAVIPTRNYVSNLTRNLSLFEMDRSNQNVVDNQTDMQSSTQSACYHIVK